MSRSTVRPPPVSISERFTLNADDTHMYANPYMVGSMDIIMSSVNQHMKMTNQFRLSVCATCFLRDNNIKYYYFFKR